MKTGIFGGTFDPIHLGHLRTVEETAEQFGLQRVLLIPSAHPPHKHREGITPFLHRLEMTRLAAEDNRLLQVQDMEGRRPGPSYSVETLEILKKQSGPETQFYFLMGMDAFLEIRSWHRYRRLFELSHLVVFNRPDNREEKFRELIDLLGMPPVQSPDGPGYRTPGGMAVLRAATTMMDISGTAIRSLARRRGSIRYLVTEPVRRYILREGLYSNGADA